jgi:hypothetical protein
MGSTIRTLIVMTPLLWLTGCTQMAWEDANQTAVYGAHLVAIDPPKSPHTAVLVYSTGGGDHPHPSAFALPLGLDGMPAAPFVYRGTKRTPSDIVRDLPPKQLAALTSARLRPLKDFPIDRERAAVAESKLGGPIWSRTYYPYAGGTIALVAWSPTGKGLEPPNEKFGSAGLDVIFPPDATILVLPHAQPRPGDDLAAARAGAIAVTPLTVAADLVLYPAAAVFLLCLYPFGVLPPC